MAAASTNTTPDPASAKCAAKTFKGRPCGILPKAGDKYCALHTFSRREDTQWWNSTRFQAVLLALVVVGAPLGLPGLIATLRHGKEAATTKVQQEEDPQLSKLVLIGEQILARKMPEFEKGFALGYKLIAFGTNAFQPFATGKTDVKVYSERRNYSLRSDDSTVTLSLPDIDLISREGNELFTMRDCIIELPKERGAQCIINLNSAVSLGLTEVALTGARRRATKEAANIAFDLATQKNDVRRAQIKRRTLRSANGIITFGPRPDLSFVTEVEETPANGVVLVFGLRPYEP